MFSSSAATLNAAYDSDGDEDYYSPKLHGEDEEVEEEDPFQVYGREPYEDAVANDAEMVDPFEVRMHFTSQLQRLNASVTSSQKAAHYALKNRDMDEDLHSCILEQLERNNMNNRANIMYFIEHLCEMARRENHLEYVRMMQRDILRVVDAVAPSDGTGAANVKVVRKVLGGLQQKGLLAADAVAEIEACLGERDTAPTLPDIASPAAATDGKASTADKKDHGKSNGSHTRPDKRQIEQRIEEDRERHKRLREVIWAVDGSDDKEFDRLWDEVSDVGEDDFLAAEEEAMERKQASEEHKTIMEEM
ncbi:MAG: hypothetical protein M1819_006857 [Sarea resinae]|nr:MAG: hypothetical protein M1819_006857 [Sarea resinae]